MLVLARASWPLVKLLSRRLAVHQLPTRYLSDMAPIAISPTSDVPAGISHTKTLPADTASLQPSITRCDANSPSTTCESLVASLERDGGVIVENLISREHALRLRSELKPCFDTDPKDRSGFFPETTQRATGLLAKSDACVELAMNKTFIDVANKMLSSTYTYWNGQVRETVTSKPIISSTVGFRVNAGGRQQALHRDDR